MQNEQFLIQLDCIILRFEVFYERFMKVRYIKHLHETKTADGWMRMQIPSDSSFLDAVNTFISILCFVYLYILTCKY